MTGARPALGLTGPVPGHLPARLTICLWDFSWYTRAGQGEPYTDLCAALDQTQDRGYTTIRICAAPLLLFGDLGLEAEATSLAIDGLGPSPAGGYLGQGTRWYDVPGGFRLDLRARFFELLDGLAERGMTVILSSWEYQQSPAFAADPAWFEAVDAVPLARRYDALARAFDRMLTAIADAGHADVVAFTELHNEVDFSLLPPVEDGGLAALELLRERHPTQLVTVSYGKPPHLAMHTVPAGLDVGQFHVYSYGVLDALQRRIDIRSTADADFPNAALRALQRPGAPTVAEHGRPAAWKLRATVVTDQMIYGYDTIDADLWDAWLYDHYAVFREVMLREIESRVIAVAAWSRWREVPFVVGEGWIGYTPLHGQFEEGPVGRSLAEHGIRTALDHGVWGVVPCSNAAPHHPMWQDAAWQRAINAEVLGRE